MVCREVQDDGRGQGGHQQAEAARGAHGLADKHKPPPATRGREFRETYKSREHLERGSPTLQRGMATLKGRVEGIQMHSHQFRSNSTFNRTKNARNIYMSSSPLGKREFFFFASRCVSQAPAEQIHHRLTIVRYRDVQGTLAIGHHHAGIRLAAQ